jgi:hypothetical protein
MEERSILLFVMFGITLLVPIIPAVIIFKLFPSDKIRIKGTLSNFTINATGGFAAYVFTVVLGFYMLLKFPDIINGITDTQQSMQFKAKLVFKNTDGNVIDAPSYEELKKMVIKYEPDIHQNDRDSLRLEMPSGYTGNLIVSLPGFETNVCFLDKNNLNNKDIVLKKENVAYHSNTTVAEDTTIKF